MFELQVVLCDVFVGSVTLWVIGYSLCDVSLSEVTVVLCGPLLVYCGFLMI